MAALKQAYETFGSECDDEEWDDQDVAMVVRPTRSEIGEDPRLLAGALDMSGGDPETSSGDTNGPDFVVDEPPPKKRRRIEIDPLDTDDEEKLCYDMCGCICGCALFPNRYPMMS